MTYRLLQAAYIAAVAALAWAAVVAAGLLPIVSQVTAWGTCIAVGNFTALAALTWLPCPCHRKDHRG
jgi:hypothetical protein